MQQQHNLHMGTTTKHVVPMCKLHVAASRSNLHRWMLVPGPPDLQQLVLVVFFIPKTTANTQPTLVAVTSATCAGGLFPVTTCAYTKCTYCNLHCVVLVLVVVI